MKRLRLVLTVLALAVAVALLAHIRLTEAVELVPSNGFSAHNAAVNVEYQAVLFPTAALLLLLWWKTWARWVKVNQDRFEGG